MRIHNLLLVNTIILECQQGIIMLDSSEFNYEPYEDGRVINRPGFTVGVSGPLLMAAT